MSFILTFLGKGGTGRTTAAIAAAKALSSRGQRVLLVGHEMELGLGEFLNATPLTTEPCSVAPGLSVATLSTALLLEKSWEEVKRLEAQYLRTPFFKNVFGQELAVLPGLDSALALYTLKQWDASGQYDTIVYDGLHSVATLRMLGMPEVLSWYLRRFREVFAESDLGKAIAPFLQPVAAAVLTNTDWSSGNFSQPFSMANDELSQGQQAVADPKRMAAYLVTTEDPLARRTAERLWGNAQQINLTVAGVILNQAATLSAISEQFAPLPIHPLPPRTEENWQPLVDSLPDVQAEALQAPHPLTIDVAQRQVKLFLPGFSKSQVQLTQVGPELTIACGDQRRNLSLPPALKGAKVTGAKFQDRYLTITL